MCRFPRFLFGRTCRSYRRRIGNSKSAIDREPRFETKFLLAKLVCLMPFGSVMETSTPMLRQYLELKKAYPGTILFFRLGDFYEMFNEDAIVGARELEITLTARQKDS